jgi:hypothetical protein
MADGLTLPVIALQCATMYGTPTGRQATPVRQTTCRNQKTMKTPLIAKLCKIEQAEPPGHACASVFTRPHRHLSSSSSRAAAVTICSRLLALRPGLGTALTLEAPSPGR